MDAIGELRGILNEEAPAVDLGQQFDVPPATVVQDQVINENGGEDMLDEDEVAEYLPGADTQTRSGQESSVASAEINLSSPDNINFSIASSIKFADLSKFLGDSGVAVSEKMAAIAQFLKDLKEYLDDKGVLNGLDFGNLPVIADLIRIDVELAGQFDKEQYRVKSKEKNERAAQILKYALEEVNTSEWVNKPTQDRIDFLKGHIKTATEISPDIIGEAPEFRNVENFIKDLQKLQQEEEKSRSSGMPVRPEKVGLFRRIKGWFSRSKEDAERANIDNSIELLYNQFLTDFKKADLSLQDQVNALEVFIDDAKKMAGGADWVMECRSVLDARRAIKERLEVIPRKAKTQGEVAGVISSVSEDENGQLMDAEVIGSGPAPFAKPEEADKEPGDSVEVSSSDEAVSPPVESIRVNAAPKAEAPAAQAPSPEVVNQEAERAPAEEDEDVDNEESKPGVTVESAAAPASVDSKAEALANPAEIFSVALRNTFSKLQKSRIAEGKAEEITSGEAYRRFKILLNEEVRSLGTNEEVVKRVLQDTFDKETRSAPRVILGMALRERGVTVKMKDGELGKFRRVEK